jgi:hypothetical protein
MLSSAAVIIPILDYGEGNFIRGTVNIRARFRMEQQKWHQRRDKEKKRGK